MGRFWQAVLTTFRFIQFLLSLIALACGAFITYKMFSMADSAKYLEEAIIRLQQKSNDNVDDLTDIFIPVLKNFQETPTRAIIVMVAALFSLFTITYTFFANRSTNHQAANKRRVRVSLELLTLLFWIAGIACAILLSLQYGVMLLAGGVQVKIAMKASREILAKLLLEVMGTAVSSSSKSVESSLDLIDGMTTVAIMAVVSAGASVVCANVAFVSFCVACCTKSKPNVVRNYQSNYVTEYDGGQQTYVEKTGVQVSQAQYWPSPKTPGTPGSSYRYGQIPQQSHQVV